MTEEMADDEKIVFAELVEFDKSVEDMRLRGADIYEIIDHSLRFFHDDHVIELTIDGHRTSGPDEVVPALNRGFIETDVDPSHGVNLCARHFDWFMRHFGVRS